MTTIAKGDTVTIVKGIFKGRSATVEKVIDGGTQFTVRLQSATGLVFNMDKDYIVKEEK